MSDLLDAVRRTFLPEGPLAGADVSFRPRSGQTDMALAVADCVSQGGHLVVEAGTGVGKTYAYLVPALLSGERVLLSTATKTLQDQLFGRDLPRLMKALGIGARVALLKGRSSYFCIHRAETAPHLLAPNERFVADTLVRIGRWAQQTRTGDLAEVPGLDERSPAIPLVTSTKENCLGSDCPSYKACFVNQARREAMAADVVVINHHLFFADIAVRESGMAELLPSCRVVIFDEAHKLNEIGVEFSGFQLGTRQVLDFCRDTLATGLSQARGFANWNDLVARLEQTLRDMRLAFLDAGLGSGRLSFTDDGPEGLDPNVWRRCLSDLVGAFQPVVDALVVCAEVSPDLSRLVTRGQELMAGAERFVSPCVADHVRWMELGAQLRLTEAPLDITALLQSQAQWQVQTADSHQESPDHWPADSDDPYWSDDDVSKPSDQDEQINSGLGKSWIYTSATLGDDDALTWFTKPCGLADARIMTVKSPFDYQAQAALYIPADIVKPADPRHSGQVADLTAKAVRVLGGRTMVLTTTLRALTAIADQLENQLSDGSGIKVIRQGGATKRELIEQFRSAGMDGNAGCVLVASASFWEGVDIPGEALQLVVIDKLPFPPPHDPLVKALGKRLESEGKNPFSAYFVPEAIVSLKQGAGRLIRHENDLGALVICDTRLRSMSYGRRVIAALPPMQSVLTEHAFLDHLDLVTRASTN